MRVPSPVCLLAFALLCGCSKGDSNSGNPATPTVTPPAPANPGTVVSTNGCAVTYACPNVDINGVANPSTPTFDRLTVSNGTSQACRVDNYRNTQPNPGANIAVEFTIRNPANNFSYWAKEARCEGTLPPSGGSRSVATAGPIQTVVSFGGPGAGGTPCANSSSGDTFVQNLTLEIRRNINDASSVVAACAFTLWGYVTPNK